MAHIRQSRLDSGLGLQAKVRQTVYGSWLEADLVRVLDAVRSEEGSYLRLIDFRIAHL